MVWVIYEYSKNTYLIRISLFKPFRHYKGYISKVLISNLIWSCGRFEKCSDEFNYLVHNFVSSKSCSMVLNISDPDSLNRIESIKFCKRAIDLCLALGSPFYSVHSGFCAALESADLGHPERIKNKICEANVRPRSYFLDLMLNSLEILSDYAAQKGIRLVFENNVLANANWDINPLLCCDPAETREILDSLNHSVGLLLDVGHKVSG